MDREIEILVVIPATDAQRAYLEEIAKESSGTGPACRFRYAREDQVTADDVRTAQVIIGCVEPTLLKEAGNLRWLQLNSAGAEQYLKPGVLPEGTVLTNSTGAYGVAVSEHMMAMVFDLIRNFPKYHKNQFRHIWQDAGKVISVEGSMVLILGVGDIGGAFAKKMQALGAYTIGIRRTNVGKPDFLDEQYTVAELDEQLPRADIVAMVLPGGGATYHIMDERRLRLMKPGAFLVNVGRGSNLDQEGLKNVLAEGRLGGCALDVTDPEPLPENDPLWDMDNVLITPHVAGFYYLDSTLERIVRIAGENLQLYLEGKELKNQVDFATGYRKAQV